MAELNSQSAKKNTTEKDSIRKENKQKKEYIGSVNLSSGHRDVVTYAYIDNELVSN